MWVVALTRYVRRDRFELGSRAIDARISVSKSSRCFSYLAKRFVTSLRAESWSSGTFSTKKGATPSVEMQRTVVSVSSWSLRIKFLK